MQLDEYSFDPSGFSLFGGDTSNIGSFDPSSYASFAPTQPDYSLGAGGGFDVSGINAPGTGFDTTLLGAPGAAAPGAIGGLGSLGGLNSIQGLLGLGGGISGLIGALSGGGVQRTISPTIGTAQKAAIGQAGQALGPAAQGQLPLQQMQASILQALAAGQIPPQLAKLVATAYDPAYQDAATRSVQAGRQAGFFDAPLSSPPGGAIMGPAAAQLQGQQANTLLGLMQSFPQLFNQPVSNQISAAQGQGNQLLGGANLGIGQQASAPLGPTIGAGVGNALTGMSQAIGQANQQQSLNQLLQNQIQGQGGISLSGSYP